MSPHDPTRVRMPWLAIVISVLFWSVVALLLLLLS
jgi:hypothetical protein